MWAKTRRKSRRNVKKTTNAQKRLFHALDVLNFERMNYLIINYF